MSAANDDVYMSDELDGSDIDIAEDDMEALFGGLKKGFLLNKQAKGKLQAGVSRTSMRHQSEPPPSTQSVPNLQTRCGSCVVAGRSLAKRSIKEDILAKLATLKGEYRPDNEKRA